MAIYVLVVIVLYAASGMDVTEQNGNFLLNVAFVLVFVIPVISADGTIGKMVVKLKWKRTKWLRGRVVIKYALYFAIVSPSLSVFSAILTAPYLQQIVTYQFRWLLLSLFVGLVVTDLFMFAVTRGRAHLFDILLKLRIVGYPCKSTMGMHLLIMYAFCGAIIVMTVSQYQYNLTVPNIAVAFQAPMRKENYPVDSFNGNPVFVLKETTDKVVCLSEPLSLISGVKCNRKTLYVRVPQCVYISNNERWKRCIELLQQSLLNDAMAGYQPSQTRIVLASVKQGRFLECMFGYYIYYYDRGKLLSGIHGGIRADEGLAREYANIVANVMRGKADKVENKYNKQWDELIDSCRINEEFTLEISKLLTTEMSLSTRGNYLEMKLDTSMLVMQAIRFNEVKPIELISVNFPIQDLYISLDVRSLIADKLLEYDRNYENLLRIRDMTTGTSL
jgi:hypothetical protein